MPIRPRTRPRALGKALAEAKVPARIPTRTGQVVAGGPWSRQGGGGSADVRVLLPGARHDWDREAGVAWLNSVVALGLKWIGDRVARPKLKVGKHRGEQLVEIKRHGLVDLWTRPNPHYGRRALEKAIALSLICDGNAYIYRLRDNGGRVCQLWWLPHWRCRPLWPSDGSVYADGFRITIDGVNRDVPASDVIHIRDGIDPLNERKGLSALKACGRELCIVNGEATFTAGLVKNAAVGALALMPDIQAGNTRGAPNPAAAEAMAEKFADRVSGDDVGGVVTLQGLWKIEQIGYSPEQLALDKLPMPAIARLASAVGTSAMSLGLPDPNKTYSNLGEANRASWGTIVAMQEMTAEAVRDDLATEEIQVFGRVTPASGPLDLVVWFDYSGIQEMQESLDALHKRTRDDFTANLTTLNEAREKLGQDPDPDGDAYAYQLTGGAAAGEADDPEGDPEADPEKPAADEDDDQADEKKKPKPKGEKSWRY